MKKLIKICKKIKDFDDFLEVTKLDGIVNKRKKEQERKRA